MSFGTSGGSARISTSQDVALSNPADGELLAYETSTQLWKNKSGYALLTAVRQEVIWDGSSAIIRAAGRKLDIYSLNDPAASVTGGTMDGDRWFKLSA